MGKQPARESRASAASERESKAWRLLGGVAPSSHLRAKGLTREKKDGLRDQASRPRLHWARKGSEDAE